MDVIFGSVCKGRMMMMMMMMMTTTTTTMFGLKKDERGGWKNYTSAVRLILLA
jgi:hypothetical protein